MDADLTAMRRIFWMVVLVLCCGGASAQVARQRLILKDGTYQVVTSYQVVGDRVRYRSAERGDEVEEIPYALVDWPATEAWKKSHAPGAAEAQAQQDAAAVDADARAQKADNAARQPEVAPGLKLPDESGVWGLDTFQAVPEGGARGAGRRRPEPRTGHSVRKAPLPVAGERGAAAAGNAHARVQGEGAVSRGRAGLLRQPRERRQDSG